VIASPIASEQEAPAADAQRGRPIRARWLRLGAHFAIGVLLVPFAFFLAGLHNLNDYGETSDEAYDRAIGNFYYEEYPRAGLANIESRLDPLQRNYGAFFDVVAVWTSDVLTAKKRLLNDKIVASHVAVVVVSSLLLATVFLLGASAYGMACGYASEIALLLMPQFVGNSQNNLKDQPVAFFFALAMLALLAAVRRGSLWLWALAGCLGGVAYAVKINGILVLPIVGLCALFLALRQPRKIPALALRFAVATAVYVATVPILWPYYRTHTLSRFAETISAFREHSFNELVFYLGQHTAARDVPWHFPLVMLGINTPLFQLTLALLGLSVLARLLVSRRLDDAAPLLLFAAWLFLPLVVQVASRVPRYDGVRHYLYLLPALALLAGIGAVWLWRRADARSWGPRWLRAAAFALPVLLLARTLAVYHPYEAVFFNTLVGGPSGARESFELDYSGTSLLQASRWLEANVPVGSRLWFTQPGIHRFKLSNDRFNFVGPGDRPDYKISLLRGMVKTYDSDDDYLHPRRLPIYEVVVKGAPILQIFEIGENRDVRDGTVLEPSASAPLHALPELAGSVTVEGRPSAPMPAPLRERLFIDPQNNPYNDHTTEVFAWGFLRVSDSGPHLFELFSDDEAIIWLGEVVLMTNASCRTTRKTVVLSPGLYPIRLKYRNEVGAAALRFRWSSPASRELSDVAVPNLVHDGTVLELPGQ
jgi:hypothetical protein